MTHQNVFLLLKKVFSRGFLAITGLALAFACMNTAQAQDAAAAKEKFKVVTTFTIIADMAREVAGDAAIVESITKPGAEIHE